ncbi:hypothetical protein [Pararhizobium arenae]|uniref:hypothetical protein n=1 Tax=Pararhizobium arenae TaxID=1856850 RepID=UPI00094AB3D8|nr:hypothetical protein [Pararhizobium arenae]
MPQARYSEGDRLVIRSGLTHMSRSNRTCRVLGVLPSDYGRIQYRVRFEHENFERRVVETDVDIEATGDLPNTAPASGDIASTADYPRSWLKPLSTKPRA